MELVLALTVGLAVLAVLVLVLLAGMAVTVAAASVRSVEPVAQAEPVLMLTAATVELVDQAMDLRVEPVVLQVEAQARTAATAARAARE